MFSKCKLLEKLELFNNDEENIKPEQKDIDPENSNKFKKFYFNTDDIKIDGGYFFDIFNIYSSITFIPSPNLNSINTSINNLFYEFPSFLTDMSYMFYNCSSLISLPDISNWNTENVENMSYMFNGCSALISLPDISRWCTKNVEDMKNMFDGCSTLISLPDISNWNTENVENMSYMFNNCSSLISLPDFSKWEKNNVDNITNMFDECLSLIYLPDGFNLTANKNEDNSFNEREEEEFEEDKDNLENEEKKENNESQDYCYML